MMHNPDEDTFEQIAPIVDDELMFKQPDSCILKDEKSQISELVESKEPN